MSPVAIILLAFFAAFAVIGLAVLIGVLAVRRIAPRRQATPRRFPLPADKGEAGENCVRAMLARFEAQGDKVVNGLIFRHAESGMTSEIDHILVSTRGAFVIETKNRAGLIVGGDDRADWIQILGSGETVNYFPSPVRQNLAHISHLKRALGTKQFFENVVVFVQGNVQNIASDHVFSLPSCEAFLAQTTQHPLTERERDRLYQKLLALGRRGATKEEHLRNVRRMEKR